MQPGARHDPADNELPRHDRGRPGTSFDSANLIGKTRQQLRAILLEFGTDTKKVDMRVAQIWQWLYQKGFRDFNGMTNLARDYRSALAAHFVLQIPVLSHKRISADGTRKYLFRLADGNEVETVYIPDQGRGTLCISSQVGCSLNCSFCLTGTQKLVRNLTSSEIVGQILAARDDLGEWPLPRRQPLPAPRLVSNIVLMGMGEPLYNFDHVRDAMKVAMDCEGLSLSRRRITLSTAGVVPMIHRAGEDIGCRLAISLHATTDEIRDQLVPINRKWNLQTLFAALHDYPRLSNADRITFEYVMLAGVNDSEADAKRLVKLIRGLPCKINLIPFNHWPGSGYRRSPPERIHAFAGILMNSGYAAPIRTPRGEDIMAACGQLKSDSVRLPRTRRVAVSH